MVYVYLPRFAKILRYIAYQIYQSIRVLDVRLIYLNPLGQFSYTVVLNAVNRGRESIAISNTRKCHRAAVVVDYFLHYSSAVIWNCESARKGSLLLRSCDRKSPWSLWREEREREDQKGKYMHGMRSDLGEKHEGDWLATTVPIAKRVEKWSFDKKKRCWC